MIGNKQNHMNDARITWLIHVFGFIILLVMVISGMFLFSRGALAQGGTQYVLDALIVEGEYFPFNQFFIHTGPNCLEPHIHAKYEYVYSVNNTEIPDPNPESCGFGLVDTLTRASALMEQVQVDTFLGFDLDLDIRPATEEQVAEILAQPEIEVVAG